MSSARLGVPDNINAPWIQIQGKEYERQLRLLGLKKHVGRPSASDEERIARSRKSSEKYRNSLEQRRVDVGVPFHRLDSGVKAPQSQIDLVLELNGKINPKTQQPYNGVEIALLVGRSPTFVSRVLRREKSK